VSYDDGVLLWLELQDGMMRVCAFYSMAPCMSGVGNVLVKDTSTHCFLPSSLAFFGIRLRISWTGSIPFRRVDAIYKFQRNGKTGSQWYTYGANLFSLQSCNEDVFQEEEPI
jgi:hypothetical protein